MSIDHLGTDDLAFNVLLNFEMVGNAKAKEILEQKFSEKYSEFYEKRNVSNKSKKENERQNALMLSERNENEEKRYLRFLECLRNEHFHCITEYKKYQDSLSEIQKGSMKRIIMLL